MTREQINIHVTNENQDQLCKNKHITRFFFIPLYVDMSLNKDIMLTFLIDIMFDFVCKLFPQNVGFVMETNCAPLLVDLLLFYMSRCFFEHLSGNKKIKEARSFD